MRKILAAFLFLFSYAEIKSQSSCASPVDLGTPTNTSTCFSLSNGTTGSSPCTGAGYGGSGGVTYVKFCTNASNSCINFTITQGTASGNWAVTIYDVGCTTVYDAQCAGNTGSGTTFNTASPITALSPNTCYIARIWSGNNGTFTLCTQTLPVTNDLCSGPMQITPTVQNTNNYCMTASAGDPAPAQFCAGSLENNAWYYFSTSCSCTAPCTVVVTISSIVCSGGGNGFQIGNWTTPNVGSCSNLTALGCVSGSAGTVTETITGLTPCQDIVVGIDGNAGANCSFGINATNTNPLPVQLTMFSAFQEDEKIKLAWTVAGEQNSDYYVVEKSPDGAKFELFNQVKATGLTNNSVNYSLYDYSPFEDVTYYRLKQVDYDGDYKYSDMTMVRKKIGDGKFTLVPNPTGDGMVTISYNCDYPTNGELNVFDSNGRSVVAKDIKCQGSGEKTLVDLSSCAPGFYFVTFAIEGKLYRTKLAKN